MIAVADQSFDFAPYAVACTRGQSLHTGIETAFPSRLLYTQMQLGDCSAVSALNPSRSLSARFAAPLDIEYFANGFLETGAHSRSPRGLKGVRAVQIDVGKEGCVISWQPQTVPRGALEEPMGEYDAATFEHELIGYGSPEFEGDKEGVRITNAWSGMSYRLAGRRCETAGSSAAEGGSYKGILVAELAGSDGLSWE